MTHIPIEMVMRLVRANTLRPCAVCQFSPGLFDDRDNMGPTIKKCPVCHGAGFVDLAAICCCGGAANMFQDNVVFCGREACLNAMKRRARPTGLGV